MTNFEKYENEIMEILKITSLAVVNGKPKGCSFTNCEYCDFYSSNSCKAVTGVRMQWAAAEAEPTMTAEDAWELVRKIYLNPIDGCFSAKENFEIFGTNVFSEIITKNTPQEAKAKIEAWKKAEEIKVGDIVVEPKDRDRGVVTKVDEKYIVVLLEEGITASIKRNRVEKTGEHVDMQAILDAVAPSDEV